MRTTIETAPSLPVSTEIERRAIAWIGPYSQAWHLVRARDWLTYLDPGITLEARLAVVTHDIERMFPNGPQLDKATGRWDDPHYLYAHAARSAEVVGFWLHLQGDVPEEFSLSEVQRLITLHEFGGMDGADLVQAADSLSFLETLQDIARKWVINGECDAGQARAKHRYMAERIRVPEAKPVAERLLEQALAALDDL
ncbi:MAG: hypothetical protein ACRDNZ_21600 [Streptosporangiaceae bacterium]